MSNRFFKPFEGEKYKEGINGKKILVLGASFYCNWDGNDGRNKCEFFNECTNPIIRDSSKFDDICPSYKQSKQKLSEEPLNAVSENYRAYQVFANFIQRYVKDKEENVWERMAFTNSLKFFSPTLATKKEYLSKRDFEAFCETLNELQPDIVIVWGVAIIDEVRENNPYIVDFKKLPETEWYVCHIKMPGVNHEIALVSCFHPSSIKYWYNNLDILEKYMNEVLCTKAENYHN